MPDGRKADVGDLPSMAELERLRQAAAARRHEELTKVSRDPDQHGWPNAFASFSTRRGDDGITLGRLADALGCTTEAIRAEVGDPIDVVGHRGRPLNIYDPDCFYDLLDHPKVIASRERRMRRLREEERVDALREAYARVAGFELSGIRVRDHRSIRDTYIDADGLTVLAGKNGAGKTALLSAVEEGLADTGSAREGPLALYLTGMWNGTVEDAQLLGAYLSHGEPDDIAAVVIATVGKLLKEPTVVGLPGAWHVTAPNSFDLNGSGEDPLETGSNLLSDIINLAHAPDRRAQLAVEVENVPNVGVTVVGADVEAIGQRLYRAIPTLTKVDEADPFTTAGRWVSEHDVSDDEATASVGWAWCDLDGVPALPGKAGAIRIRVVDSDGGIEESIHPIADTENLMDALTGLHDMETSDSPPNGVEAASLAIAGLLGLAGPSTDRSDWFSPDESRVALTLAGMHVVAGLANAIAPEFIGRAGRITLLPPQDQGTHEVAVGILDDFGTLVPVDNLSSGIQRWVVLLVDFASSLAADLWRSSTSLTTVDQEENLRPFALARELAARALTQDHGSGTSIQLLVADEPELHLHPSAQQEVVEWFLEMSRRYNLIVATHAPAFLQLTPAESTLTLVTRDHEGATVASPLDGAFLQDLDALAEEIGLGRERLIQLLRGLVVVEGKADKIVLERFAQPILARYRLAIVSIRGHGKAKGFAEGDLAVALGIPIAVMFDDTTAAQLEALTLDESTKVPDEVRSLAHMLKLRDRGLRCDPIHFGEPDVIAAIPEATVRRRFPRFESWEQTRNDWLADPNRTSFKNFVLNTWQVSARRDLDTIRELAVARQPDETLPPSMERVVKELSAWAETLSLQTAAPAHPLS